MSAGFPVSSSQFPAGVLRPLEIKLFTHSIVGTLTLKMPTFFKINRNRANLRLSNCRLLREQEHFGWVLVFMFPISALVLGFYWMLNRVK
jgi:hypothetical protein